MADGRASPGPDSRARGRPSSRLDWLAGGRPSPRLDSRAGGRPSPRLNSRAGGRPSPRLNSLPGGRPSPRLDPLAGGRPSPRLDSRANSRSSPRLDSLADGRPSPGLDSLADSRPSPGLDSHLLECPLCLRQLRQPNILPCLHSFCKECLGTYKTTELTGNMASATSFPCPVCRKMAQPVNLVDSSDKLTQQFPTFIQELAQRKEHYSKPVYCKPCKTKRNIDILARFWCNTLNTGFCETCKVSHHDVVHDACDTLEVTTKTGLKREPSTISCREHTDEISLYCEDHQMLGCSQCMFKDHRRCEEVAKVVEYFEQLTLGSQLDDMKEALRQGAEVMDILVKDFDEQLRTMVQNQEVALQSITDLRQQVDRRIDKLQKDITDELVTSFKRENRKIEASMQQCKRLMTSMTNTLKSSITALERQDQIETILLYQKGQAEVESCKNLVTEMRKSFTSVSITHEIDPSLVALDNDIRLNLGEIVVKTQSRRFPDCQDYPAIPLSERRVKEIGKFSIRSASDSKTSDAYEVAYLPGGHVVVVDFNNTKLKLFTDQGQCLDEIKIYGHPWDMCKIDNNTVALAVSHPGGVRVVKVVSSKLEKISNITMPHDKGCYGVAYVKGMFVVSTGTEIYTLTTDGTADRLYEYSSDCYRLAYDQVRGHVLVNQYTDTLDMAISKLSVVTHRPCSMVLKTDVVRYAEGIDVDREGNIYVCGRVSNNVIQMSGDGTNVRELLTSTGGVTNPNAISVCGDKFVLTDRSEKVVHYIRVYQFDE